MVPGAPFFGFAFVMNIDRRRGCGNVGIAKRFPRAVEREGKPVFGFPRFPRPVISTASRVHAVLFAGNRSANRIPLACCIRFPASVSLSPFAFLASDFNVSPALK